MIQCAEWRSVTSAEWATLLGLSSFVLVFGFALTQYVHGLFFAVGAGWRMALNVPHSEDLWWFTRWRFAERSLNCEFDEWQPEKLHSYIPSWAWSVLHFPRCHSSKRDCLPLSMTLHPQWSRVHWNIGCNFLLCSSSLSFRGYPSILRSQSSKGQKCEWPCECLVCICRCRSDFLAKTVLQWSCWCFTRSPRVWKLVSLQDLHSQHIALAWCADIWVPFKEVRPPY